MSLLQLKTENIRAIGLMSGTSLDGLDIAYCEFQFIEGQWFYRFIEAETIPYSGWWKKRLSNVFYGTAEEFSKTHVDLGHYFGQEIMLFSKRHHIEQIDLIASHGHTVFHNPKQQFTTQIGDLAAINAISGLPTVGDFRTKDLALGGNGAPLVPIGDEKLFNSYSSCVNLGGFANISFAKNKERLAFDCCPVNLAINYFSDKIDLPYDAEGQIAANHPVDIDALIRLNQLHFYQSQAPKSLGREWFEDNFLSIITAEHLDPKTAISTCTEHAAIQIAKHLLPGKNLITGGGAYNDYLLKRIQHHAIEGVHLVKPEAQLIEFKEAMIFAFLGTLKLLGEVNVLKSVTGAKIDHSSGAIYL
jgi:anhydro-N-acetylmuramic acid kinase